MNQILDLLKKDQEEEKAYMIKGDNVQPLWGIPLTLVINMDTEDDLNNELINERKSKV